MVDGQQQCFTQARSTFRRIATMPWKLYRYREYRSDGRGMSSVQKVSICQVKAAGPLLAWSQADLVQHSGVLEPTVKRLESQDGALGGRTGTAQKIVGAFEAAGIRFISENGEDTGVRLHDLRAEFEPSSIAKAVK
jgi:hypothetical protein